MTKSNQLLLSTMMFLLVFLPNISNGENEITSFNGGTHLVSLKLSTNFFSGLDSKTARFGNTISSAPGTPSVFAYNPAGIGAIKKTSFSIDIVPPITLRLSKLYTDLDNTLKDATDDAIADMKSSDLDDKMVYPDFDMDFGQKGIVNSFSAILTSEKHGNLGIGYSRRLDIDIDALINGISTTISDIAVIEEGGDTFEEKLIVPLAIESFINMNFQFHEINIAYGKSFFQDKLSMGAGLNIISSRLYSNIFVAMDGIIRQASEQTDISAIFDDPNVDYRNTLDNSFDIDFHQKSSRPRFGISCNPIDWLYLDFAYCGPTEMKYDGHLEIIQHTLGALNFGYDEDGPDDILGTDDDEEMMDLNYLKPSQITYTNETIYRSDYLKFEYPGYLANSIAFKKKWFTGIISYEKPIGSFSVHYKCDVIQDGQKKEEGTFISYTDTTYKDYKIDFSPEHTIKFALGFGPVSFGGQVLLGDILYQGFMDDEGNPKEDALDTILGGAFSFGFGFNLSRNLYVDMNLIAVPGPIARTTLIHEF